MPRKMDGRCGWMFAMQKFKVRVEKVFEVEVVSSSPLDAFVAASQAATNNKNQVSLKCTILERTEDRLPRERPRA